MTANNPTDWYDRRAELREGMVFLTREGDYVQLERRVAGDATKWFVADWCDGTWFFEDNTVEAADLVELKQAPAKIAEPAQ